MIRVYQQLIGLLHWCENVALVTALTAMLGMAVLQILLRNLMDSGIYWADPFLRILVLWVALLGAMVATRERGHISIDALSRYLPIAMRRIARTITNSLSAVICLVVSWYCVELIQLEAEDGTLAFGSVPTWATQLILPIAFLVMGIRFLVQIIVSWLRTPS